eukprot:TRINITY_DN9035_c2_g1_i1.p1 TRINITY_DN9035_c2_g1~~TRINITY_DN9035_c2_g1_i1.p1  ORF type:complete len:999 (+),score=200.21 TRINITY_DN9035_c2_g1_i1:59-3055(+)
MGSGRSSPVRERKGSIDIDSAVSRSVVVISNAVENEYHERTAATITVLKEMDYSKGNSLTTPLLVLLKTASSEKEIHPSVRCDMLSVSRLLLHRMWESGLSEDTLRDIKGSFETIQRSLSKLPHLESFVMKYQLSLCTSLLELLPTPMDKKIKSLLSAEGTEPFIKQTAVVTENSYTRLLFLNYIERTILSSKGYEKRKERLSEAERFCAEYPSDWCLQCAAINCYSRLVKETPGLRSAAFGNLMDNLHAQKGENSHQSRGHSLLAILGLLKYPLEETYFVNIEDAILTLYLTEPDLAVEQVLKHSSNLPQVRAAISSAIKRTDQINEKLKALETHIDRNRDAYSSETNSQKKNELKKQIEAQMDLLLRLQIRSQELEPMGLAQNPFDFAQSKLKQNAEVLGVSVPEPLRRSSRPLHSLMGAAIAQAVNGESNGKSVKKETLEALEAFDEWTRRKEHGYDRDRRLEDYWDHLKGFDWDRQAKGQVCDAQKSILVGISELSAYEDPDRKQLLLFKFFDTEQKVAQSYHDDPPAVWALGLTAPEVAKLGKMVAAGEVDALIHREPQGEVDLDDEPWYAQAYWVLTGDKVTGIKLSVKVSQDSVPEERIIKLKLRGPQFEKGDIEKFPVPLEGPPDTSKYTLPKSEFEGDREIASILSTKTKPPCKKGDSFTGTGNSLLQIKAVGEPTASNSGQSSPPVTYQSITSPKFLITNPSESRISVTEFFAEYKNGKGEWCRFVTREGARDTVAGTPNRTYNGRIEVRIVDDMSSFEVESHETAEVHFTAREMLEGVVCYSGGQMSRRLHHQFMSKIGCLKSGIVQCRVTLIDDANNTKQIEFEHSNEPLTDGYPTYEDAVADLEKDGSSSGYDGIGSDCDCQIWLSIDNPLTLDRYYVICSREKEGAEHFYTRISTSYRSIPSSVSYTYASCLKRIGYKAKKENKSEVELNDSKQEAKLIALIDPKTGTVYGLKAEIHIKDPVTKKTLVRASESSYVDFSKLAQK